MIRLVALACGLLCGAGLMISGLYDPSLVHTIGQRETGPLAFGLALFVIVASAAAIASLARGRGAPVLGGNEDPLPDLATRHTRLSGLVFGFGWGLAGYVPLTAFVSAGALSPGAVVFLASVLIGMVLVDVATGTRGTGRRTRSFG